MRKESIGPLSVFAVKDYTYISVEADRSNRPDRPDRPDRLYSSTTITELRPLLKVLTDPQDGTLSELRPQGDTAAGEPDSTARTHVELTSSALALPSPTAHRSC